MPNNYSPFSLAEQGEYMSRILKFILVSLEIVQIRKNTTRQVWDRCWAIGTALVISCNVFDEFFCYFWKFCNEHFHIFGGFLKGKFCFFFKNFQNPKNVYQTAYVRLGWMS